MDTSPIKKSMLLQVTISYGKIYVSDGENFAHLNYKKELETVRMLKGGLSPDTDTEDLIGSLFLVSDFSFSHHWDYHKKEIAISIDSQKFDFISPASRLEIHRKDRTINSILTAT